MKKIYLIIIMMIAIAANSQSIYNQEFAKANLYYNESKYDTALVIYQRIIDAGYVSSPLLYNIGNTYFKLRNYPMAILNYEKALKIDPTNEEVKQNLAIANALITDKIEPMPEFFMKKWWRNIGNSLSANGWATLSIILFAVLLLSLFLYLTTRSYGLKKTTFFTNILLVLLCLCSVIFASQKKNRMESRDEAIVITPTITIKSSPSQSGVDLFVLHEGTKVEILDGTDNWDKIRIADGSVGWMPSSSSIKY